MTWGQIFFLWLGGVVIVGTIGFAAAWMLALGYYTLAIPPLLVAVGGVGFLIWRSFYGTARA